MTIEKFRALVRTGVLLSWLLWPQVVARAHVGSPYPVLLEQPVGPYVVSALADPDVGVGTFLVQVALPGGSTVPADTAVTIWVRPQDGHAAVAGHQAVRQPTQEGPVEVRGRLGRRRAGHEGPQDAQ